MVTSKCTHALASLLTASLLLLLAAPAARADEDDDEDAPAPQLSEDRAPLLGPAPAGAAPPAVAAPDDDDARPGPALHHSPISSAKTGEPLTVQVQIERPYLVKRAVVVYRTNGRWYSLALLRAEEGYAGTIPAEHIKPPGIDYTLEIENADGARTPVFATRAEPQPVVVRDDAADVRERWLLDRVGGRRSLVSATAELVRFGTTTGAPLPCAAGQQPTCKKGELHTPRIDDQYWRAEAAYTYRPLRAVSEFGFRIGVVRGESLVDLDLATYDSENYSVGLNYAAANVRFRLADILHTDLELLGSVTEIGFSSGAGAAVILGDPLGTRFTAGWQTIGFTNETNFGTRFYTRLDLKPSERITLAPSVEVTNMPHADRFGVRLLLDSGFTLGRGFSLWVRGGYQARISQSGGPTIGTTVQYGF